MNGSWKIGTLAGIGIYLHWTFSILLAWVAFTHVLRGNSLGATIHGIVFIAALFLLVVLHELGHALAARRYGISTRDITLLPIGGVARLERMPDDPRQELVVALAGPAVNVVLAGLCALGVVLLVGVGNFAAAYKTGVEELGFVVQEHEAMVSLKDLPFLGAEFLSKMLLVNIVLVVFNLLPAFPMDGGRVLRALLAMRMDYVRATQIAASFGQTMALLFGFLGLFTNPFLVFIALFVWMGASSEASMVQVKSGLQGIPVSAAMITDFSVVEPQDPLSTAAQHILAGFQHDFPVVDHGQLRGVLTKTDLLVALANQGPETRVSDVMQTQFETATPAEMLETVFQKLQTCDCHSLPIVQHGNLVGIITMENVGEFLAIQSAVRQTSQPSGPA